MGTRSVPPATYRELVRRFPSLGRAWELCGEAGREGPLDERTARLIKLGMSMAALREGAVHSGVRRAVESGITPEEVEQLVALLPSTLGFPATAAVYTWVREVLPKRQPGRGGARRGRSRATLR